MTDYKKLMKQCLALAKKGEGKTTPNPMVGCVVLDKKDNIIATGYHHKYGENHAERDALLKLKNNEAEGGTLIVNLEPCSHFGKTPPCVDLIIERKLKRVVIGSLDNNPKVNGQGIKKLKDAGIEVINDVLKDECRELNKIFFTNVEEKRTFIALKTATTLDGKISTSNGNSKWITSEKSRKYGKKLRKKYDAILTSSSTVITDNPEMKHNKKIIIDRTLKTNPDSKIYKQGHIFIVIDEDTNTTNKNYNNVTFIKCKTKNNQIDLNDMFKKLYENNIKSVFIEAGGNLCGSIIKECPPDVIYQFIAPKILNDNNGRSCFNGNTTSNISECKNFEFRKIKKLDTNILIEYISII